MVDLKTRFAAVELAKIQKEKVALARENHNTVFKTANGFGQRVASIPRSEYMLMMQLYGRECWHDPDFVKAFLRDNPEARVKTTRGTRGQEILQANPLPKGSLYVPKKYAPATA